DEDRGSGGERGDTADPGCDDREPHRPCLRQHDRRDLELRRDDENRGTCHTVGEVGRRECAVGDDGLPKLGWDSWRYLAGRPTDRVERGAGDRFEDAGPRLREEGPPLDLASSPGEENAAGLWCARAVEELSVDDVRDVDESFRALR